MNAAARSSWTTWSSSSDRGGEGEGERRRARTGGDHGVADPARDPLVDEGGAERRSGQFHGMASIVAAVLRRSLVRRRVPLVLHRQAHASRPRSRSSRRRRRRDRVPPVPARPDRAARRSPRRWPRPTPRSSGAPSGPARSSATSPRRRRRRARLPPGPGRAGQHARRPPGALARREHGHQGALKERLLQAYFVDGRNVGDRRHAGAPGRRGRARRPRWPAFLESDAGVGEVRDQLARAAVDRHHRGAHLRDRRPLVDPRRPGPRDVPAACCEKLQDAAE